MVQRVYQVTSVCHVIKVSTGVKLIIAFMSCNKGI